MPRPPRRFLRTLWLPLLALAAFCAPFPAVQAQVSEGGEPYRQIRLGYLERWRLLRVDGSSSGLERFASLVQEMADDALARSGDPASPFAGLDGKQLFLDDLVDLFVPDEFRREKELVMVSEPLLVGEVIVDGPSDLTGFRADLQVGSGRFRHFALNAVAAYRYPPFLVAAAAQVVGNDLEGDEGLSADSQADLATNEIGRSFAQLLRLRPLAELADGVAVETWLLERFGPLRGD